MDKGLRDGLAVFGCRIEKKSLQKLERFMEELLRWNEKINLTAITKTEEVVEKHLLDSLFLINYLEKNKTLLDMGSGAGFPGVPLAVAMSDLRVTTIDSVGKKINFQKHVKRVLGMENLYPIHARLEDYEIKEAYDYAVARAFSSLQEIIRIAVPFLKNKGQLLVMKGPEGGDELTSCSLLIAEAGLSLAGSYEYELPHSHALRQLIILTKT